MNSRTQLAPVSAADLAGDLGAFTGQLGSDGGAAPVAATVATLGCPRVTDAATLDRFLSAYASQVLVPLELPAIFKAWGHASRFEARELVALDVELARAPLFAACKVASLHAGRSQLRRLRPLRDHRLVQRYVRAVEAGEASGWHTLVFGVTLAVFSLPPRQGLVIYAHQTLGAFARCAGRGLDLTDGELNGMVDRAAVEIPGAINALVEAQAPLLFRPAEGEVARTA